ncbi:MAG: tetratricopeptide repeat protein [Chloroflexota bacterium]
MNVLNINLLGSFNVSVNGQLITQFRSTKAQALLAWLAAHPDIDHSRTLLATLLWGNLPDSRAKTNLRIELSGLKKRLDSHPALKIERSSVRFESRHAVTDLQQFQEAFQELPKTISSVGKALNAIQGELLAGLQVDDAPDFEDWRLLTREQLHQQQMQALDWLANRYSAEENWEQAVVVAQQQLALESWHEPAHCLLMRGLVGLGQMGNARWAFERCCQVLEQELSIKPSAETQTLWRELQRGEQPSVGLHNLPLALPPLFGRQEELTYLNGLLENREARLITLLGQGGSGKTRLALAVAHEQKANFADGVWFVSLAGINLLTAVIPTIADALNMRLAGEADPAGQLEAWLRRKELLLILDNVEHLPDEVANVVALLLKNSERLVILVTSRRPLRLRVENRVPVGSLQPGPAHDLFVSQMQQLNPFSQPNQTIIEQICALLGYLPLGIELAAAQLEHRLLSEIATVLSQTLSTIETSLIDVPDRQRNLVAVFESSWVLLNSRQQMLLAKLSIFRGTFGIAEATDVLGDVTQKHIEELQQQSLLQKQEDRYSLHPVVQQLASEKLRLQTYFGQVANQHSAIYLNKSQALFPLWRGIDYETAVIESRQFIDNLTAAWEHALATSSVTIDQIQAVRALYRFRGLYHVGVGLFESACHSPAAQDQLIHGWLLAALSWFQVQLRQNDLAKDSLAAGLEIAKNEAYQDLWLDLQLSKQILLTQSDQYQASVELGEKIVAATSHPELSVQRAAARLDAGFAKLVLGAAPEAEKFFVEAEKVYSEQGDLFGEITAKRNLGISLMLQSRHDEAKVVLNDGIALAQQRQDREREIFVMAILGLIHNATGDFGAAVPLYEQQLAYERMVGVTANIAAAMANLAINNLSLGQHEKALNLYLEARPLMEHDSRANFSALLTGLAQVHFQREEYEQVAHYLDEGLAVGRESGLKMVEGDCLYLQGDLNLIHKRYDEAIEAYQQSIRVREELKHGPRIARARIGLARATLLQGDNETAKRLVIETMAEDVWRQAAQSHHIAFRAFEVLAAVGDAGADEMLREAKKILAKRAAAISDPVYQHSFLQNVAIHKRIEAANLY